MDHEEQSAGLYCRDIDLLALVDAVLRTDPQQVPQLPGERPRALKLLEQCAVEHLGTWQTAAGLRRSGAVAEQVISAAVDPARVTVGEQKLHRFCRQNQGTHKVPT